MGWSETVQDSITIPASAGTEDTRIVIGSEIPQVVLDVAPVGYTVVAAILKYQDADTLYFEALLKNDAGTDFARQYAGVANIPANAATIYYRQQITSVGAGVMGTRLIYGDVDNLGLNGHEVDFNSASVTFGRTTADVAAVKFNNAQTDIGVAGEDPAGTTVRYNGAAGYRQRVLHGLLANNATLATLTTAAPTATVASYNLPGLFGYGFLDWTVKARWSVTAGAPMPDRITWRLLENGTARDEFVQMIAGATAGNVYGCDIPFKCGSPSAANPWTITATVGGGAGVSLNILGGVAPPSPNPRSFAYVQAWLTGI